MKQAGLSKGERLKSRKAIEALVRYGKRKTIGEITLAWHLASESRKAPVRILIAVPKRNFKRAVDRNLLKRRIREAYRLNKQKIVPFFQENTISVDLMFLYQGTEILDFAGIEEKIVLLLKDLLKAHE